MKASVEINYNFAKFSLNCYHVQGLGATNQGGSVARPCQSYLVMKPDGPVPFPR